VTDFPSEGESITTGQLEIEQYEIDAPALDQRHDFIAGAGRADLEAFLFKVTDELLTRDRLVFND
jgi:hypothetical protein